MKIKDRIRLVKAALSPNGAEILNPKPLMVADKPVESIEQKIARMIKTTEVMKDKGFETYEESIDFEIDDDFDNDLENEMAKYQVIEDEYYQKSEYQSMAKPEIVQPEASERDPKTSGMEIKTKTNPSPPHPKLGGEDLSHPAKQDAPSQAE